MLNLAVAAVKSLDAKTVARKLVKDVLFTAVLTMITFFVTALLKLLKAAKN